MISEGAEKSQQCHNYFLQYSTFASERPQVRISGRQTCFMPRAPSNFVTPLSKTIWDCCWPGGFRVPGLSGQPAYCPATFPKGKAVWYESEWNDQLSEKLTNEENVCVIRLLVNSNFPNKNRLYVRKQFGSAMCWATFESEKVLYLVYSVTSYAEIATCMWRYFLIAALELQWHWSYQLVVHWKTYYRNSLPTKCPVVANSVATLLLRKSTRFHDKKNSRLTKNTRLQNIDQSSKGI